MADTANPPEGIKRYGPVINDSWGMCAEPEGKYVLHADYLAVLVERDEARAEVDRLIHDIERVKEHETHLGNELVRLTAARGGDK